MRKRVVFMCVSILVILILIGMGVKISSLQRENSRLYVALKCAYLNIDNAVREDRTDELRYALIIDLTGGGYSLDSTRRDKALGCFSKFGLQGN